MLFRKIRSTMLAKAYPAWWARQNPPRKLPKGQASALKRRIKWRLIHKTVVVQPFYKRENFRWGPRHSQIITVYPTDHFKVRLRVTLR